MIIGSRESPLAQVQAKEVIQYLDKNKIKTSLLLIKSQGDLDSINPLYAMGIQGVFTKSLDQALLNKKIDIAVHSFKDVPTQLANGLSIFAVLKRSTPLDALIAPPSYTEAKYLEKNSIQLATGSLRRKAQWLYKYPHHQIVPIRGNISTRLQKIAHPPTLATLLANTALNRLSIKTEKINRIITPIDWMVPAPAQGAIVVIGRTTDEETKKKCDGLNDPATNLCTSIEREILFQLQVGCSSPIGALATKKNNNINCILNFTTPNGKHSFTLSKEVPLSQSNKLAEELTKELKKQAGNLLYMNT